MPLETATPARTPAPLALQFVSVQIMPLIGGKFSVALEATLLDEDELEFVGQDLASAHVDTLDQALAVIRANMAVLDRSPSRPVP